MTSLIGKSHNRNETQPIYCTAFAGDRCIASGDLLKVALKTKEVIDRGEAAPIMIFDVETSELIEVDFRGTTDEVLKRLDETADKGVEIPAKRGPGRPKLGVVGREV